jgi:spermidine/putrescine-binding protein
MWFDQMAIPVDAPNPEGAHAFLNFIMDPENMAAASNYVYYANGNLASQEFLNEDVIGDPAIYPPIRPSTSWHHRPLHAPRPAYRHPRGPACSGS